jgi:LPXTG-motif cell wall-anchored protein
MANVIDLFGTAANYSRGDTQTLASGGETTGGNFLDRLLDITQRGAEIYKTLNTQEDVYGEIQDEWTPASELRTRRSKSGPTSGIPSNWLMIGGVALLAVAAVLFLVKKG